MERRAWGYFVLVAALWGVPYFLIKVALHDLTPVAVVFWRVAIGTLTLLPVALATGALRGMARYWRPLLMLSLLEIFVPFLLIASGETRISSSLTGILIATEPLFVTLLARYFDHTERPTLLQLGGMLAGLAGVIVLLGLGRPGAGALTGSAMILGATLSYAGGAILTRRALSHLSPVGVTLGALGISAALLAIPASFAFPYQLPSRGTLASLVLLGTACTGVAFILFIALISLAGARRATLITYVAPAIAVVLGVALGGDPFTGTTAAGLALILGGSVFATGALS